LEFIVVTTVDGEAFAGWGTIEEKKRDGYKKRAANIKTFE
jgi:hypothetical protein